MRALAILYAGGMIAAAISVHGVGGDGRDAARGRLAFAILWPLAVIEMMEAPPGAQDAEDTP